MTNLLGGLGLAALACLGLSRAAAAQGGPPLATDDPGTPGPGRTELNVSAQAERDVSGTVYDTPRLDANFGVGDRLQLKLEVPWRVATAPAQPTETGVGNVGIGVKWRFAEKGSLAVSTFPQLTFGRSENAQDQGIAQSDAEFLIPIEVAWIAGPVALNADMGYQNAAGAEEIIYGLAAARGIPPSLELLGECHGSGDIDLTHQGVLCGLGFRWKLEQAVSLMGAFAAAVAGASEDRSDYRAYGGVQLRW
jgi:hypothetical protein